MIFILYFGSLNLIFNIDRSLIMFILWTLWWPFLYITLIFLGRFWCGFLCPIGLTNEMGNSLRKAKKDYLMKYSFLPFVVFFLIVFWEQVSGLFSSAKITILFLLTFFISAFLLGIVIPRWGFCRHFCPIGTLFKPFGRLSMIGLRTNKDICRECKTKECIKGGRVEGCPVFLYVPDLESNKDCLLCTNCIKNCPYDSAKLKILKPGEELSKKASFNLQESLFIVALLGLTVLLTSSGTQLLRIFGLEGSIARLVDFILWISIFLILYFFITYISNRVDGNKKENFKEDLIDGGYVFLPIVFSLMFFLIVFGFITPLTKINENLVAISKYAILLVGASWSVKLSIGLFKKRSWIYLVSIIGIFLFWILILIPGPLSLIKYEEKVYIAEHNETLNMKSFNMGYDPKIIKTAKGGYFDLNITDLDIPHDFIIDELNIRVNFDGGENKIIRINLPNKSGEYEYYCGVPGHREGGMKGLLIVE